MAAVASRRRQQAEIRQTIGEVCRSRGDLVAETKQLSVRRPGAPDDASAGFLIGQRAGIGAVSWRWSLQSTDMIQRTFLAGAVALAVSLTSCSGDDGASSGEGLTVCELEGSLLRLAVETYVEETGDEEVDISDLKNEGYVPLGAGHWYTVEAGTFLRTDAGEDEGCGEPVD